MDDDMILDKTEEWHKSDSELELYEYLGMSWNEYKAYVENKTVKK